MLLTHIFLHNWHRFHHEVIAVEDGLYFAGHNASGKSSILDAIQLVLIADQNRVRYNSSASTHERSVRNLDSYVRGKIGENRWLRPGNAVAYVALEFTDAQTKTCAVVGVCVEAGEVKQPERTFFILSEPLDPALFVPQGRPLTRRDLNQLLSNRRGARAFKQIGEYQQELLNRLGGLNQRFFDLFLRALSFQPIRNIDEFVEQWLLEAQPLAADTLQQVVERLGQLRVTANDVKDKLAALEQIVNQQTEVHRLSERFAEYALLQTLLHEEHARRMLAETIQRSGELDAEMAQTEEERAQAVAVRDGAKQALSEAERIYYQSDDKRHYDDLRQRIADMTRDVDQIRLATQHLRRDLQQEAALLGTLRGTRLREVDALVLAIAALDDAPPSAALAARIDAAIRELDSALSEAQREHYSIDQQIGAATGEQARLERELADLRRGQKARRSGDVERVIELLTPLVGTRPRLLCDLLDIPDERWQNAVEAMLGGRRFNIIVPPAHFDVALRELDRVRAAERIYDVGLIDLARAHAEGRRAQPGSLAEQVRGRTEPIQSYVNSVLGDIMCCDTVETLRRYRRAVTPEVVLYSEYSVRALPPRAYTPWYVGARAQQSQIESREHAIREITQQVAQLAPQADVLKQRVTALNRGRDLSNLRLRLEAPLDDRPLRDSIAEAQAELAQLDTQSLQAQKAEVERLGGVLREAEDDVEAIAKRLGGLATRRDALAAERQERERQLAETAEHARSARDIHASALDAAEALLAERQAQPDLAKVISDAANAASRFKTQAENARNRLIELGSAYNTQYQFAALPGNPDEPLYAAERERLLATELPRYTEQIEQAQREAEEELREHVLHKLREHILLARQNLDRINDALSQLTFHGDRYRFSYKPADDVREFYELIIDSQMLGSGALFTSDFYRAHKPAFDRFYGMLTQSPRSDADQREQQRLLDYRRYLSYDIEISDAQGGVARLSKIMGQTSGGETQTPFYLTIAASFVQLYHLNERTARPTIRLIAFDEAFSKMDQDRIGATLDLFQEFGLQIITATPLERCEYIVPKLCTSLVLTRVKDHVLIEPYRNYAARLNTNGEHDHA